MITYKTEVKTITTSQLNGFFVGWPNPPSNDTFLKILNSSYKAILAIESRMAIDFITAISDGILTAYIPLLEVHPDLKSKGIGKNLVLKMQQELKDLYMIDLLCDEGLIPYYEKLGMQKATGALIRNYGRQNDLTNKGV